MTTGWRPVVTVLLALGLLLLTAETAFAQCAMCRRTLASPEGQELLAALRAGILILLAAPLASFATVAFLAVRRQRRRELALGGESGCPASIENQA